MKYLLMTFGTILTIAISSTLFACGSANNNGSAKNSVSYMGNKGDSIMLALETSKPTEQATKG